MAEKTVQGACGTESSDEDEFVDAQDEIENDDLPAEPPMLPSGENPSLEEGLAAAFKGLNLFLFNQFEESKMVLKSPSFSMYHSVGHATVLGLQAMMTLDQTDIANALEAARTSLNVAKQSRRKSSVFGWNRSKSDYTLEELHAELIYAESLLLYALLTFLEDENLVSFVKAALKIRRCFLAYNECHKLLGRYKWDSAVGKAHFESGVRLGYGLFNVLISNLPPRIMHLLEFVGFSGDRDVGLKELEMGIIDEGGLRTPLCWLALLSYNLVAVYAFGLTRNNLPQSEDILKQALSRFPNSVMFVFFRGKFEQVSGRFLSAIEHYERAVACQSQWQQFHHLCYWEEMVTYALLADWLMAMKLAENLYNTSRWSKALYQYLKASFLIELLSEYKRNPGDVNAETIKAMKTHVGQLMEEIPSLRQRIAGKSVPIEKFAAAKATKYSKIGSSCMPGIELVFVLNWTRIMSADQVSCAKMLDLIDAEMQDLGMDPKKDQPSSDFKLKKITECFNDDLALAVFLRGSMLRELHRHSEAKLWLMACSKNWSESKLSDDTTYILPGSWIEMAHIAVDAKNTKLARSYLDEARSFKQYHHVSRMQFRIHALQQEISSLEKSSGLTRPKSKSSALSLAK